MSLDELRMGGVYWFYDQYAGPRKVTCLGPPSDAEIYDYFGGDPFVEEGVYQKIHYWDSPRGDWEVFFEAWSGYSHYFEEFLPNDDDFVSGEKVDWDKSGF